MTPEEADAEAVEAAARAVHQARSWPSDPTWDDTTAFWRGICRTEAQAAITAYLAAMEAAGFVVAPVEPTEEMAAAIRDAVLDGLTTEVDYGEDGSYTYATFDNDAERDVYRAMLAARPKVTP